MYETYLNLQFKFSQIYKDKNRKASCLIACKAFNIQMFTKYIIINLIGSFFELSENSSHFCK